MSDPIFSSLSYFKLKQVSWTVSETEYTTEVLEGYDNGVLTSVIYLGDEDPTNAYAGKGPSNSDISAAAYATTATISSDAYPPAEVGGDGKVLAIPYEYFGKLATEGLDFKAVPSTNGSTDILLLDGTKIELYDAGSDWSIAKSTQNFDSALAALNDNSNDVSLNTNAAISVDLVGREVDADGSIGTAFSELNTLLTAYYDDTGTTPEIALAQELMNTTADSTGKVISEFLGGLSSNYSLYAFKTAIGSDHTNHLYYNGSWVEVITADTLAALNALIITDPDDTGSGDEYVDPGIVQIGTFYNATSKNLKEVLQSEGLLSRPLYSQRDMSELGGVLWGTDQFDDEGYFWHTSTNLTQALNALGYTPQYDSSQNAITSELFVDTSDNKKNFVIEFYGEKSAVDGVNFSGSSAVNLAVVNLDNKFSLDIPSNFVAGSNLYIYTNSTTDQDTVKMLKGVDTDFDVIVQGNRALDITDLGSSSIPADWIVKDGAHIIMTPAQYTVIGAGSNTSLSSNATLHLKGTSGDDTIVGSQNGDTIEGLEGTNTITGGLGNDKLHADQGGVDNFVFAATGDGDDVIYNFNSDSDSISLDGGTSTIDVGAASPVGFTVSTDSTGSRVITYGSTTTSTITLVNEVNDSPLKLTEVDGARWGDYVTFAVESKSAITDLVSLSTEVKWNTSEFEYVAGSLEEAAILPAGQSGIVNTTNTGNGVISLEALFASGTGITTSAGDDFFTFMLKRIDTEPRVNNISLDYVQYQTDGVSELRSNKLNYSFDYVKDNVKFNLETDGGIEASRPKIIVADGNVMDGLSIVPIATYKDFTQYQVVLNISYPTAYVPLAVPDTYTIEIDGDIIDSSIYRDQDARLTAELAEISQTAMLMAPGSTMAEGDYTEAWANLGFAQGYNSSVPSIVTQDGVEFSIDTSGLIIDRVTTTGEGADEGVAHGRYSLATFIATNEESIKFVSKSSDDATGKTVNISASDASAYDLKTSEISRDVNDGSEVYLLGDHWYENPGNFLRAVTAADALATLRMVADDSSVSNASKIAADFDRDTFVTAMDAWEILQYAAKVDKGAEPAKFMDGQYRPEWFFIDNVEGYTVDSDSNGIFDTTATPLALGDISFDTAIDQFVGKNTVIDATAVLVGDVTASYSVLSSQDDPIYQLGYYTPPITNGGGGGVTGGSGGLPTGVDVQPTWNVSSQLSTDRIGAPGASIMGFGTGIMVTAADAETSGTPVTAEVSDGIMSFTSGGSELGTLDEWKDAAEIVAADANTASIDKFVLGFVDGGKGKTYVFELDDSATEGTFVVSKTTLVDGVATSLSTGSNMSTSIKIDTAAAPVGGGSTTVGTSGNDTLTADPAGSFIAGTTGVDTINLGAGADTVQYAYLNSTTNGHDVIIGFSATLTNADKLELPGPPFAKVNAIPNPVDVSMVTNVADDVINASVSSGGELVLGGPNASNVATTQEWASVINTLASSGLLITDTPGSTDYGTLFFETLDGHTYVAHIDDSVVDGNFEIGVYVQLQGLFGVNAVSDSPADNTIWIA